MKIRLQLFAAARQWAGADAVELDVPSGATVADVRKALLARLPRLAQFGLQLRFAVNADYADEATTIPAGANLACIPPVSGG
ncbi:MAG TPA: MoaD/ThiS family protein [Pirellulales bacterium]|nr:MoaD/ThiS family protein [Pirellulales bacterium]